MLRASAARRGVIKPPCEARASRAKTPFAVEPPWRLGTFLAAMGIV